MLSHIESSDRTNCDYFITKKGCDPTTEYEFQFARIATRKYIRLCRVDSVHIAAHANMRKVIHTCATRHMCLRLSQNIIERLCTDSCCARCAQQIIRARPPSVLRQSAGAAAVLCVSSHSIIQIELCLVANSSPSTPPTPPSGHIQLHVVEL